MTLNLKQRWSGAAILVTAVVMGLSVAVSFGVGTWIADLTTSQWMNSLLANTFDAANERALGALDSEADALAEELRLAATPAEGLRAVERSSGGGRFRPRYAVFPADPAAAPLTDMPGCVEALRRALDAGGWEGARDLGCGVRPVMAVQSEVRAPGIRAVVLATALDDEYLDWFTRVGMSEASLLVNHAPVASTFRDAKGARMAAALPEADLDRVDRASGVLVFQEPIHLAPGYGGFQMTGVHRFAMGPADEWVIAARRLSVPGEQSVILISAIPHQITHLPTTAGLLINGVVALLLLAGTAAVISRLVGRFTVPLEALAGSARAVMAGDLSVAVPEPETPEVRELVVTYNHMRDNLRDLISQRAQLAREAGMAEIATGVLHNIGNVLNSVTVSAGVLKDTIHHASSLRSLGKVVAMLHDPQGDLAGKLREDPKGRQLGAYLQELAAHAGRERTRQVEELSSLTESIEHIKRIVATQQSYAKAGGFIERCRLDQLAQDALRLEAPSVKGHHVEVISTLEPLEIDADPHRVLQILVNLIANAIQAMDARPDGRQLRLRTARTEAGAGLVVEDNGPGIAEENLARLFTQGFTTKAHGHGFGLHNSGLAAREMGGALQGENREDGPGARFTLALPAAPGAARAAA